MSLVFLRSCGIQALVTKQMQQWKGYVSFVFFAATMYLSPTMMMFTVRTGRTGCAQPLAIAVTAPVPVQLRAEQSVAVHHQLPAHGLQAPCAAAWVVAAQHRSARSVSKEQPTTSSPIQA